MTDSARTLAAKLLAGVGLLAAGCQSKAPEDASSNRTPPRKPADRTPPPATPTTNASTPTHTPSPADDPDTLTPHAPTATDDDGTPRPTATPRPTTDRTAGGASDAGSTGTGGNTAGGSTGGGSAGGGTSGGGSSGGGSTSGGSGSGGSTDGGSTGGGSTDGGSSDGGSTGGSTPAGDSTGGGSSDGTGGSTTGSVVGPHTTFAGDSTALPFVDGQTVTLGEPGAGYLCDLDLGASMAARYSFVAADGRALDCHLLAREDLDAYRDDRPVTPYASITGLSEFELGPVRLSAGRYALVVEPATADAEGAEVTYEFELRSI